MTKRPAPSNKPTAQNWRDVYFTARDGLRLYARHYPAPGSTRRPLVCLPGLTRNSKDFHDLATEVSDPQGHRRAVYCLDYRGRGRSAHDPDWKNYTIMNELLDVMDFMTLSELHNAAILGTSRGGLIAMFLAVFRPSSLGAVILNDIGPVIETTGLARIVAYVGRVPLPATWEEAARSVKAMNKHQFTAVPEEVWAQIARQTFNDDHDHPVYAYDRELSKAISTMDGPLPDLWPQFYALGHVPLLVLRGENSDILSEQTVTKMRTRHPNIESATVRGQGHAPFLKDNASISLIKEFLMKSDDEA